MKIEHPNTEQINFYKQFESFKIVNKDKYNEYLYVSNKDTKSILSLTEQQRKYVEIADRAVEKRCVIGFTFKQYQEFMLKPCVYCKDISSSIDRIDSKKCYTLDNVQQTCAKCNIMKYILSDEDFRSHIIKIYNNM